MPTARSESRSLELIGFALIALLILVVLLFHNDKHDDESFDSLSGDENLTHGRLVS